VGPALADPFNLSWGETALRLVAGAGFGGVLGIEREWRGHEAGARTHMLLALGAALFGVLSVGAFGGFFAQRASTDVSMDPTRIASYVAAGIGFLGAGTIMKEGDRVRGLTTAASLWAVAAVGLASGLGFWPGAVIASAIALVTLLAERPLRAMTRRWPGSGGSERGGPA
jgi:putative Mg2+ transporter-C (MgtC) family protein